MTKAFTTYKLLRGKEPLLRQIVCEVRYEDGQLYLDHCGRLLKKLVQRTPEWTISPSPSPQGTTAFHLVDGLNLSFSMTAARLELDKTHADAVIDQTEVENFILKCDETIGFILDEIEATELVRLGYREWYYFSCETKTETEQWLRELELFSVTSSLLSSFRGTFEALGTTLVLQGEDRHFRIALNGVERSAQVPVGETTVTVRSSAASAKQKKVLVEALKKQRERQINTPFAAVLDIDTYQIEPIGHELGEFVRECNASNLTKFRDAIAQEPQKKGK